LAKFAIRIMEDHTGSIFHLPEPILARFDEPQFDQMIQVIVDDEPGVSDLDRVKRGEVL
jgi:hypothetical protein